METKTTAIPKKARRGEPSLRDMNPSGFSNYRASVRACCWLNDCFVGRRKQSVPRWQAQEDVSRLAPQPQYFHRACWRTDTPTKQTWPPWLEESNDQGTACVPHAACSTDLRAHKERKGSSKCRAGKKEIKIIRRYTSSLFQLHSP